MKKKALLITNDYDGDTIDVERNLVTRCPACGKVLFKGRLCAGSHIETKCTRNNNEHGTCKLLVHFAVGKDEVPEFDSSAEARCPHCNKLLFKGTVAKGSKIETACTRPACQKQLRFESI